LVNALKTEAESQSDSEQQKKLLAAAKMLADATARMVEAAKVINAGDEFRLHFCEVRCTCYNSQFISLIDSASFMRLSGVGITY
jgi:hypothetical protein